MTPSDADVEFLLQLYDTAKSSMAEKSRGDWAEGFIFKLLDYGFDVKSNAEELGEHDEYLDKAVQETIESDELYDLDEEYADDLWEEEENY